MQGERWRQVDKIFHDLIDQTPEQRASFLEQVCANDPSLKKEVEQLIEAYERSGLRRSVEDLSNYKALCLDGVAQY
jgi:hypothetical protein